MISIRAPVKVMAASDAWKQKRGRKESDRHRSSVYKQLQEMSKDLTKLTKDLDTMTKYIKEIESTNDHRMHDTYNWSKWGISPETARETELANDQHACDNYKWDGSGGDGHMRSNDNRDLDEFPGFSSRISV